MLLVGRFYARAVSAGFRSSAGGVAVLILRCVREPSLVAVSWRLGRVFMPHALDFAVCDVVCVKQLFLVGRPLPCAMLGHRGVVRADGIGLTDY